MSPCTKARILTFCTRTLAVVASGLGVFYAAPFVAQHFDTTLTDPWQIGVGVFGAAIAFLISKRALDFTQDCMTVPDELAAGLNKHGDGGCRKKACRTRQAEGEGAKPDAHASPAPPATTTAVGESSKTTVTTSQFMSVAMQPDTLGELIVTVTITGVPASRFKAKQGGLRAKIEGVSGVKWEHPKNLGTGTRIMVGRVTDPTRREAVIAALQEIARG
jgi:hypothetical protein